MPTAPAAPVTTPTAAPAAGAATTVGHPSEVVSNKTTAPATPTTTPTPAPKQEEKKPPTGKDFAALSQAEKRMEAKRQEALRELTEAKKERESLKKEREALTAFELAKAKAKENPLAAMKELGLDLGLVNEYALRGGEPTPEQKQQALIDAAREDAKKYADEQLQKLKDSQQTEAQTVAAASAKMAIDQFNAAATKHVRDNAVKYPLTNNPDGYETVHRTMRQHYDATSANGATPTPMSFEEAAQRVEDDTFEQVKVWAANPEVRAKLAPLFAPADPPVVAAQVPAPKRPDSITNRMTPGTQPPPPANRKWIPEKERMASAAEMYAAEVARKQARSA